MKNLPENSPQPTGLPADNNGAPVASNLNGAASASALSNSSSNPAIHPSAVILLDRAELNSFWPEGIRGFKPREEWQALCHWLSLSPMKPALN
jgi:hypothetical protein